MFLFFFLVKKRTSCRDLLPQDVLFIAVIQQPCSILNYLLAKSFAFNYFYNAVYVFLADLVRSCFYHNTDYRLCSTLANKDTSVCSEFFSCFSLLPPELLRYPVLSFYPFTRTFFRSCGKIFTSSASVPSVCFFSMIASHNHKRCQDTVTCTCMFAEDDMSRTALRQEHIHS